MNLCSSSAKGSPKGLIVAAQVEALDGRTLLDCSTEIIENHLENEIASPEIGWEFSLACDALIGPINPFESAKGTPSPKQYYVADDDDMDHLEWFDASEPMDTYASTESFIPAALTCSWSTLTDPAHLTNGKGVNGKNIARQSAVLAYNWKHLPSYNVPMPVINTVGLLYDATCQASGLWKASHLFKTASDNLQHPDSEMHHMLGEKQYEQATSLRQYKWLFGAEDLLSLGMQAPQVLNNVYVQEALSYVSSSLIEEKGLAPWVSEKIKSITGQAYWLSPITSSLLLTAFGKSTVDAWDTWNQVSQQAEAARTAMADHPEGTPAYEALKTLAQEPDAIYNGLNVVSSASKFLASLSSALASASNLYTPVRAVMPTPIPKYGPLLATGLTLIGCSEFFIQQWYKDTFMDSQPKSDAIDTLLDELQESHCECEYEGDCSTWNSLQSYLHEIGLSNENIEVIGSTYHKEESQKYLKMIIA
jgi:hypothetical protein